MKRIWLIALLAFALTGCGRKDADETEKKPTVKAKDSVQLSEESLKLITLETFTVGHSKLDLTLRAPGRVSFNLNRTAKVTATFEGRIVKLNHDLGEEIHEGDVMALLDSPEMLGKPLELKAPVSGQVTDRQGMVGELLDKGKELYTISDQIGRAHV